MLERITARRERRMKATIFRGIYEDNLRIVGRTSARERVRRGLPRAGRAALTAAAVAAVVLSAQMSFAPQFAPGPRIEQRVVPPAAEAPPVDPEIFRGGAGLALSRSYGLGVHTILLDAGHGGEDTGAIGHAGTREKDVALDIVRRLRRRLTSDRRFNVELTRDGDETLPLPERTAIARADRADLFISVHLNFLPQKPINIVETFYFGPAPDAKTVDLARRENGGGGAGMSEFREILESMGQRMRLEESRALAASIQAAVFGAERRADATAQDYGTKRGPFFVLHRADVPAVLAEVSCLSNEQEEARLATTEHREEIAASLEAGIRDYLRTRETTYDAKK
jgi:N-acetylmuramoyl-L-alanine amidase